MAYYGLTRESIEAAGGKIQTHTVNWPERDGHSTSSPPNENDIRDTFDIVIGNAGLQNNPENVGWPYITQRWDLNYLQLPQDLLAKLAKDFGMERRDIPLDYLRGIDHPIHTVVGGGGPGNVVYGRADNPDAFVCGGEGAGRTPGSAAMGYYELPLRPAHGMESRGHPVASGRGALLPRDGFHEVGATADN
jgi:hypothetical protein